MSVEEKLQKENVELKSQVVRRDIKIRNLHIKIAELERDPDLDLKRRMSILESTMKELRERKAA